MTTATAAQPVSQASAQTAEKPEVPIRHMKFDFNAQDADPNFYLNAELASAYFEALSIFLTYGEDLVIDTARYHRDFLTDPVLKQRVTSLIGQEALHSKVHEEWNEILKEHRFPVPLYRFLAENFFNYGFKRFPHRLQLSLMAGIEHFTAVLAEFMMKHEDNFFHSEDEKQRGLWMWHMLEEAEHKDIAYDVYQELSGSYLLRITGFALALFTIWFLVPLGGVAIPFLRNPRKLVSLGFWKDAKRSLGLLIGRKNGVYGSTLGHVFDYLRPDFHPNDHDTSEYLEYYKERLLHPETGLLTPYFVKQVVPPVRA
ncbi:metal-dependent hydrolase [Marinobacter sp. CA1]|uniref:metal-dependent hydrolase n=1 Tax=Marinobacter sp. CA1 TaxID=2817656 RepID=UPI001D066E71|nr:metal-dependent hydrolase [Marinobacter sp. CA1]UDL06214.1 metal-dependent hydrolase [Marinobacter sp. CA1]